MLFSTGTAAGKALMAASMLLFGDSGLGWRLPSLIAGVAGLAAVYGIVRAGGIATLFTEHDMDVVFGFADRVIVLDRGNVIAQGTPASVRADPRVREVYFGVDAA